MKTQVLTAALLIVLAGCKDRGAKSADSPPPQPASAVATPTPTLARPAEDFSDGHRRIVVDGHEVVYDKSSTAEIEVVTKNEERGPKNVMQRDSASTGTGLRTSSEQAAQKFSSTPATADVEGGSSSGGFGYDGKLTGGGGFNLFHALGAGCVLVGLFFGLIAKDWTRAAAALIAGGVMIAIGVSIEKAPMLWILGLVVLLGLGVLWIYDAWKKGRLGKVVQTVVPTVATLSPEAKDEFKEKMSKADDGPGGVIQSEVEKIKAKLKL